MCSEFLKKIIELDILFFLKKITLAQHYKITAFFFISMMLGLFFAEEIYRFDGILKCLIILIAIIYLGVYLLHIIKGLMLTRADLKSEFVAFYYCLWLAALIVVLFILTYYLFDSLV